MEETKRIKILVGVNTLTSVDQAVYANHCQLWFRLGRSMPDCDFAFYAPRRSGIDRMRNDCGKVALAAGYDYICFIDDDVLVPLDGIARLRKADKPIVAGWTIIRGHPFDNMFFKWNEGRTGLTRWNDPPQNTGLLQVGAVGFSFCLIKTSVLREIPEPWFVTGTHNTEDIYFCYKYAKYVPDGEVFVDLDCITSHNLGSEFIDPTNRKAYTKYFEECFPTMIEPPPLYNRADDYANSLEEMVGREDS